MKIAVIGGGPAGMMSAIAASKQGAEVTLFEKNEKTGKKLYISGKGRCNLTNDCAPSEFLQNVVTNAKFLQSAIHKFTPADTLEFCADNGLLLKTERGNRVFPQSDKSSDVIKTFNKVMTQIGVKVILNASVLDVVQVENGFEVQYFSNADVGNSANARNNADVRNIADVRNSKLASKSYANATSEFFDKIIVATGGYSYRATGCDGFGYALARQFGHTVTPLKPALCRILCSGAAGLEGISLKNVAVSFVNGAGKVIASEFGEMLFTADGISGPAVLSLSSQINKYNLSGGKISIDLKPALDLATLDARILRDFSERFNKNFENALDGLLPSRLVAAVVAQCGISADKKVHQVTAVERAKLAQTLKNLVFGNVKLDDVEFGIVTSGGVSVSEINPSTMESKRVAGLYFCGEVLDVDAYTGGFNIQIALSTGHLAGISAASQK